MYKCKAHTTNNGANEKRLIELIERTKRIAARIGALQEPIERLTIKTPSTNDLFSKAPKRRLEGF